MVRRKDQRMTLVLDMTGRKRLATACDPLELPRLDRLDHVIERRHVGAPNKGGPDRHRGQAAPVGGQKHIFGPGFRGRQTLALILRTL